MNNKNGEQVYNSYLSMVLITFAGIPTAIEYGGISFVTTEPVPITLHFPILTFGSIITFAPSQASSSIIIVPEIRGNILINFELFGDESVTNRTEGPIETLSPNTTFSLLFFRSEILKSGGMYTSFPILYPMSLSKVIRICKKGINGIIA